MRCPHSILAPPPMSLVDCGDFPLYPPQKEASSTPEAAPSAAPLPTVAVDTLCKLFRIYSNFLRGKLKLYTGQICRRGDR